MSFSEYNTTFKRPTNGSLYPGRSPSPPRKFVEPLSPAKPRPIEPHFNYPAINNHVDFQVRPVQPFTATPKARDRSGSYRSGHHRTPSTIDTLAEAALALSPSHAPQGSPTYNSYSHVPTATNGHEVKEPPHKRARSEVYPSPMVGQYASRPATSYEQSQGWARGVGQQQYAGHTHDRSLEEAALLLNFRTSGWSTSHSSHGSRSLQTATIPAAPRPHANSFPQDSQHSRPIDFGAQTPLLPPFNPQESARPRPTLPSPTQTVDPLQTSPQRDNYASQHTRVQHNHVFDAQGDVHMADAQEPHSRAEEETSRATSMDVTASETSEATTKLKRASTKAKSRASSGRKSIAEKAASGRVASRKKSSSARSKAAKQAAREASTDWDIRPDLNRRKSFNGSATANEPQSVAGEAGSRSQSVPPDTPMVIRPASPSKAHRRNKEVTSETICAGCEVARETTKANPEVDAWVSCNGCKKWFHIDCAGFKKASEVRDVDKFFCAPCEPTHGKTTYVRKSTRAHAQVDYSELQRGVLKTSEESMEHHYIQPIKDGTFQFDPESFPRMRPELVTREFFEKSGTFTEPICIPAAFNPRPWLKRRHLAAQEGMSGENADHVSDIALEEYEYDTVPDDGQDKLDMIMPEDLTVRQVCNLVGPETPLDVIDVKTQNSGAKWTLGRWADYYEEQSDDKPIQNVISLEVSQSKLGRMLRRPKIVRDIDLQDEVWPQEEKDRGKWPKVQYYCLMSAADSYTDFHIDFGGSSVYYHILRGQKTFFFIPPKAKHLKAYEEWNDSPQQNYTFLPNITGECYRVDLHAGDTMLIPSGWIHAVWTPATSLVIGGNFLNRMSYQNQFKVAEIEKANETPMKFRYPFFQKIMWYTAIKYLKDDPLPQAVSQAFYDGKRYDRQVPLWADFDGEIAAQDERPGAKNARYYGQAELDGLPDLVNFIFRTVMLVLGRIEGITADRMKRVNASIPKGHGEPLEIAKTFALWVAWKRGNEDPPAWAHPDAVLPNSKEEGPPKKLSQRALKEMERKEAIAAWRVAPDRQSERVRNAAAAASTTSVPNPKNSVVASAATPDRATSFTPSRQQPLTTSTSNNTHAHQDMAATASAVAPPMAFMMNPMPGQHLSTPKTSVLGPKRVACDACRKRRIRCKHKDVTVFIGTPQSPGDFQQMTPGAPLSSGQDLHENITVTPPKTNHHFAPDSNGSHQNGINGNGPLPGTNAYVNANIPMTMNGVPIFGEAQKRGRTKACFECRKSKRRCVHDENGNVDPIKAAETPVPRGSNASKKRPSGDESTPIQPKKKLKAASPTENVPIAPSYQSPSYHQSPVVTQQTQAPQPTATVSTYPSHSPQPPPTVSTYPSHSYEPQTIHHEDSRHSSHEHQSSHPPIDPTLFAYSDHGDHGHYDNSYAYSSAERPGLYGSSLPSLDQIASEVLDMTSHDDYTHDPDDNVHVYNPDAIAPLSNGLTSDSSRPDDGVDSGISLVGSDTSESRQVQKQEENSTEAPAVQPSENIAQEDAKPAQIPELSDAKQDSTDALPSIEHSTVNGHQDAVQTSPSASKANVESIPLYRPPAPPSASPELSRRQVVNGLPTPVESNSSKRKRESASETPKNSKKAKRTLVTAGAD
ncbi:JmjC domain-containing histone demethylation protein 1 [Pseudocercospora fuligena]|uniref:JmjC domain-containing histone demethylation protein 1 n=1 Tax=Pseudocercospora fuligena TaxID=685502 RepID=A0A8H6R8I1_9PEZI|nr:JmjC domain-containing histone demethylation protein 1 [Pseudocercospora fuligena]